jgi:hypothetical protein
MYSVRLNKTRGALGWGSKKNSTLDKRITARQRKLLALSSTGGNGKSGLSFNRIHNAVNRKSSYISLSWMTLAITRVKFVFYNITAKNVYILLMFQRHFGFPYQGWCLNHQSKSTPLPIFDKAYKSALTKHILNRLPC